MNGQKWEVFKPNGIWVASQKYDTQEAAEAAAMKRSAEYKETYAVRPVYGETVAIFESGKVFKAVGK